MVRLLWTFICAALTALSVGSDIQEIFKDTTCDGFAMVTLEEWMNSIAVAPEKYIVLEAYELSHPEVHANCKHRFQSTDTPYVFFLHTRCYNIVKQKCQDFHRRRKFEADRCGRAEGTEMGTGNAVMKFFSTDLDSLLWAAVCDEWDTKGQCTLGFVDIIVKESLMSKYDHNKTQAARLMLEKKYNTKFSNVWEEFKDELQECPME